MARTLRTRGFARALAASVGLSVFFLVLYAFCNWMASRHPGVPTLFFEWERGIPFIPLMIAPYMSLDLLFVAAPFLCRSNRELWTLSKRIIATLFVAGLCFLLFPFRFAFDRPHAAGWLGAFFDWFQGMDRPFNLLPSLHIAFCVVLGDFYARQTRGLLRWASNLWFVLIALSAVLTYQHHVMDVLGGFALGAYCLYFFPDQPGVRRAVVTNARVASYYLGGTLVTSPLVLFWWPWGAFLLWLTIAFAIMSAAYFGVGPQVFRKQNGRLPWTTWWTLGPIVVGQHLSRLYYRRQCAALDELTPRVWIGGVLNRSEAAAAISNGVTAVLDLTAEFSEARPFHEVTYRNIPILDLTAPTRDQLEQMMHFIEQESASGIVYVHCKIGYSRTAAVAAAWLLRSGVASTTAEAIDCVRRVRPCVVMRPEVVAALHEFAGQGFSSRPAPSFSNTQRLP
jgi:protein-tyrosine phosphatase/membrane-associated phospholipid phosphatase